MHGIVFEQLREFVWRTRGADAWTELVQEVAPERRFYAPDQKYDDSELEALIAAAAAKTGATRGELLRDFGVFIAPTLADLYAPMISPQWSLLDLLEHVEETIHHAVRLDDPSAAPPQLRVERRDQQTVVVLYNSPRRMCELAIGIITGLQNRYGESVSISDPTCMHRGDDICTIEVRRDA